MNVSRLPVGPFPGDELCWKRLAGVAVAVIGTSLAACGTPAKPPGRELGAPQLQASSEGQAPSPQVEADPRATATTSEAAAAFRKENPGGQSPAGQTSGAAPASAKPSPTLPADLVVGRSIEVPVEGDRALRVAHADGTSDGALVYLHGMCGDSKGAEPWLDRALQEGTLIVVRADVPCPDRPGYKWPKEVDKIQTRIDQALALVKNQRGGLLDTEHITLIGYSQGADRAEQLAAASPARYPWVILGGPPSAPEPTSFRAGVSVAVLGGELEDASHMMAGASALSASGLRARFFLLPRAHHGDYGPEGPVVMDGVLNWLFSEGR